MVQCKLGSRIGSSAALGPEISGFTIRQPHPLQAERAMDGDQPLGKKPDDLI
jgi:hypothetical protein